MPISPEVAHYRATIASITSTAVRRGRAVDHNDPALIEARRRMVAAVASDRIERIVAAAPPFTDEQRTKLAELLQPVRIRPAGGVE